MILFLFLGVLYFALDRQLFYYGKNDFNIYHLLPLNIKPEYRPDFEDGFALYDEYGFTIAAKGNTYKFNDKDIHINAVLKYCFNNEKLNVLVEDVNNKKYYIEFSRSANNLSKKEIVVNVLIDNSFIDSHNFKFVDIKNNDRYIRKIELFRNYTLFINIAFFLYLTYMYIKYRKK